MHDCHYCESPDSAEYDCPRCGGWTCEDCFETMTQFNAGHELLCLGCRNASERADYAEADKLAKREAETASIRAERSRKAKLRYHSPEARQARADRKTAELERRKKVEKASMEAVGKVLAGFSRFF